MHQFVPKVGRVRKPKVTPEHKQKKIRVNENGPSRRFMRRLIRHRNFMETGRNGG